MLATIIAIIIKADQILLSAMVCLRFEVRCPKINVRGWKLNVSFGNRQAQMLIFAAQKKVRGS